MSTFAWHGPWAWWWLWNVFGFFGALVINSFVEWASHRWILHSNKIVKFAYLKHHVGHHGMFLADETYHANPGDDRRNHVVFVLADYFGFLLFTTPIWVGVELLIHRPILAGGVLATLAGLQAFNSFHWLMHCPGGSWFEKTWFFKMIDRHHREHHADPTKNFNVHGFPIADLCLGTFARKKAS